MKRFSYNHRGDGTDPIEYAGKQHAFSIQAKLMIAFSEACKQAFGKVLAPVSSSSSSTFVAPAAASYTPSFSHIARPTYEESKELIENLRKGYPALATGAFNKYKNFYLGLGQCYLPDILQGAIDGNQTDFIALLVRETAAFSEGDLDKLYDNFAKLNGVNGKTPKEYAVSNIKFRASNCLLQAEFTKDRAKFTY